MDMVAFCEDVERLGKVHVMVFNKGAFAECNVHLAEPKVTDRYVNYYGTPTELHFARNPELTASFESAIGQYSKKMEHGIAIKAPDGETYFRVSILRDEEAEDHSPEKLALFEEMKEKHGG